MKHVLSLICVLCMSVGLWMPIVVDAQLTPPGVEETDPTAGSGLVPCDGVGDGPNGECTFTHFVQLLQNLINWLIFIAVPLSAIIFTYAGIMYVTAAGDPGKIAQAHGIFKNVAVGFIIVLGAWLIVYTITSTFLRPESGAQLLG